MAIGGKSLREHFEAINHKEAIDYVEAQAAGDKPVNAFHVRQIHKRVFAGIDDANTGQYRNLPIRIAGARHQPPESWEISHLMTQWAEWLHSDALALHAVERAALAHHRLAAIHPFIDGNGRTARLVLNLILLRDGYPPTIILRENRAQYYRVLAQADTGREAPIANFVGRAVERSLTVYLDACTPQRGSSASTDRWIPLRQAPENTPYSQEYLSLLARAGRLEAVKRGKVWYTTQQAVDTYRRSVESSGETSA